MGRVKTTTMSGSKHTARRSNSHLPSTPTAGAVHLPGRVSASVSASASAASTPFDSPVSGPSSLTKKSHAARRKLKKSAMENLSAAANVHSATEAGAADALPSSRPSPPPQAADDEDGEAVVVAGEQPGPGSQPEVDHAADHASWKLKLEQSKARRDKMQSAAQNVEKPLKEVVEALRPLPQYAEFINETLEPRLDDLNSLKNSTHNLVIVGPAGLGKSKLMLKMAQAGLGDTGKSHNALLPVGGGPTSITKAITCLKKAPGPHYSISVAFHSHEKLTQYARIYVPLSSPTGSQMGGEDPQSADITRRLQRIHEQNENRQVDIGRMTPEQYSAEVDRIMLTAQTLVAEQAASLGCASPATLQESDVARLVERIFSALDSDILLQRAIRYIIIEGPFEGIPAQMRFFDVPGWGTDLRQWNEEALMELIDCESIVMLATSREAQKEDIVPLARLLGRSLDKPPLVVNAMMFREDAPALLVDGKVVYETNSEGGRRHFVRRFSDTLVQTVRDVWTSESEGGGTLRPLQKTHYYLSALANSVTLLYQLHDTNPADVRSFLEYVCSRQLIWRLRDFAHSVAGAVYCTGMLTGGGTDSKKAGTQQGTIDYMIKTIYPRHVKEPQLVENLKAGLNPSLYTLLDNNAKALVDDADTYGHEIDSAQAKQRLCDAFKIWMKERGVKIVRQAISDTTAYMGLLFTVNLIKKVWSEEKGQARQEEQDGQLEKERQQQQTGVSAAGKGGDNDHHPAKRVKVVNASGKQKATAYVKNLPDDGLSWQRFNARTAVELALGDCADLPGEELNDYCTRATGLHGGLLSALGQGMWTKKNEAKQDAQKLEAELDTLAEAAAERVSQRALQLAKYQIPEELLNDLEVFFVDKVVEKANTFVMARLKAVQQSLVYKDAPPEIRSKVDALKKASVDLAKVNKVSRLPFDPHGSLALKNVSASPELGKDAYARIYSHDTLRSWNKSTDKDEGRGSGSTAMMSAGRAAAADEDWEAAEEDDEGGAGSATAAAAAASGSSTQHSSWMASLAPELLSALLKQDRGASRHFQVQLKARADDEPLIFASVENTRCGRLSFRDSPAVAEIQLSQEAKQDLQTCLGGFGKTHAQARNRVWPMFQVLMSEDEAIKLADFFKGERQLSGGIKQINHFCMFLCANEDVLRALMGRLEILYGGSLEQLNFIAVAVAQAGLMRTDVLLEVTRVLCLDYKVKYFWLLPPTPTEMNTFDDLIVGTEKCTFLAGLRSCEVMLEALEHECVDAVFSQPDLVKKMHARFHKWATERKVQPSLQEVFEMQQQINTILDTMRQANDGSCSVEAVLDLLEKHVQDVPHEVLVDMIQPLAVWLRASTLYTLPSRYAVNVRLSHPVAWHVIARAKPKHNYVSPILFNTFACAGATLVASGGKQQSLSTLPFHPVPPSSNSRSRPKGGGAPAAEPAAPSVQTVGEAVKRYIDNKLYYKTRRFVHLCPLKVSFRQDTSAAGEASE